MFRVATQCRYDKKVNLVEEGSAMASNARLIRFGVLTALNVRWIVQSTILQLSYRINRNTLGQGHGHKIFIVVNACLQNVQNMSETVEQPSMDCASVSAE